MWFSKNSKQKSLLWSRTQSEVHYAQAKFFARVRDLSHLVDEAPLEFLSAWYLLRSVHIVREPLSA